ncbi:hypothetical protein SAMN04489810_3334 [Microbacterium pygmaeum]|uniref:Uncharacterized protein n=1 Tax=Microbacterium pygmaeum TaxID=370764 RepID=A0A1G8DGM9_9MICO|nr:hypothetical protein SAMN04489810_3334 [Microbacterium pygmaeum]
MPLASTIAANAQRRIGHVRSTTPAGGKPSPKQREIAEHQRALAEQLVRAAEAATAYRNTQVHYRDQYYAELEALEPDERLRDAIEAAQKSNSQRGLIAAWRDTAKKRTS